MSIPARLRKRLRRILNADGAPGFFGTFGEETKFGSFLDALARMALEAPESSDEPGTVVGADLIALPGGTPGQSLGAAVRGLLGSSGLDFAHDFHTGASDLINSITWTALAAEALAAPSAGTYLCLHQSGIAVPSGASSDYQYAWGIDGADPVASAETQHDATTAAVHDPAIHMRVLSLAQGQTVQLMARRVTGTGTLSFNRQTSLIVRLGA